MLLILSSGLSARKWTDNKGNSFIGEIVSINKMSIRIKSETHNGKTFEISMDRLSAYDNEFIELISKCKRGSIKQNYYGVKQFIKAIEEANVFYFTKHGGEEGFDRWSEITEVWVKDLSNTNVFKVGDEIDQYRTSKPNTRWGSGSFKWIVDEDNSDGVYLGYGFTHEGVSRDVILWLLKDIGVHKVSK